LSLPGPQAARAAPPVPNGATWTQIGANVFKMPWALVRSQGLAVDGTNLYFSWQSGLQKTDGAYSVLASNSSCPSVSGTATSLATPGSKHIGDIDVANDTAYASLDSSTSGRHARSAAPASSMPRWRPCSH
jgi:hypothetical protein